MPRPQALTAEQKKQLTSQIERGADLPALVGYAAKKQIKVSRTTLGEFLKATRERKAAKAPGPAPAAEAEPTLAELRQAFEALARRVAQLEVAGVPRLSLLEAATQAVQVATQMSQDPNVDPGVRVKALAVQPDLIDSARRVRESEEDEAEEGGGAGGLFNAGPAPVQA